MSANSWNKRWKERRLAVVQRLLSLETELAAWARLSASSAQTRLRWNVSSPLTILVRPSKEREWSRGVRRLESVRE